MSFLPQNYDEQISKIPKPQGDYFRIADGEKMKVRILGPEPVVTGWVYWGKDGKPHRSKELPIKNEFLQNAREGEQPKFFLCFIVWNYTNQKTQIWEVTQKTIRAQLEALIDDEDWGDPYTYDITVSRKGEKLETEYNLLPSPGKKDFVPPPGWEAINLDALFTGENPFETAASHPSVSATEGVPF